ncbi:MAG TPA: PHP domain-containing protein [Spirochaetota bacterium]|mgnify:FL=1|nr:PHP domain-containing protein [Spirochaetota bacterium]HPO45556.1 PHP domain-containing protein [Spirochaetota bacterium]
MIDLHTHTSASDGLLRPSRLVELAARQGVRTLAVTDHDTMDGVDEALASAAEHGIRLIPGIEFSVEYPSGSFHLVGLFVDHLSPAITAAVERLKAVRENRGGLIIAELENSGVSIPLEEVVAEAAGGALGKPHFARVMVRRGYAGSVEEVFERYLVDGRPGDVPKKKIPPSEAIGLVLEAGGLPILAHPSSLGLPSFEAFGELLDELRAMGLAGIEAYAALHTEEEVRRYEAIALGRGLLVSGGSDFHGEAGERPGYYRNGLPIPTGLIDEMDRFRGERTSGPA